MLDKITFNHFFIETKNLIDSNSLPFINPESQVFFKASDVYFALSFNGNKVYINFMVGKGKNNLDGMRILIKELKANKVKFVLFGTSENNKKMLAIAKYIESSFVQRFENYYADGSTYIEYELDLDATGRL